MAGKLPEDLTGAVLVASPLLIDPNFRRTILFLSNYSKDDGALGFVLNRPTGSSFPLPAAPDVDAPMHYGGPVQQDALVFATLQWREPPGMVAFHTFGDDPQELEVPSEWQEGFRVFTGYAGWSPGQLEGEIAGQSWLVLPPSRNLVSGNLPDSAWRDIMRGAGPLFALLAEAPDDPTKN